MGVSGPGIEGGGVGSIDNLCVLPHLWDDERPPTRQNEEMLDCLALHLH